MSFYAGKYNSKTQCHITRGNHDISVMRGGVGGATIFHSDVKYITFSKYEVDSSELMKESEYFNNGYYVPWSQAYYNDLPSIRVHQLPLACRNAIGNGYAYLLIDSTGHAYYPSSDWAGAGAMNDGWGGLECFNSTDFIPCPSGPNPAVPVVWGANIRTSGGFGKHLSAADRGAQYGYGSVNCNFGGFRNMLVTASFFRITSVIVFNFKYDGSVNNYPALPNNGSIYINRDKFLVGGVDISQLKFVTTGILNNADASVVFYGDRNDNQLQFINSVAKDSGIKFYSKPGETALLKGGHTIINSNYLLPVASGSISDFTISPPATTGQTFYDNKLLAVFEDKTYKNGDLIIGTTSNLRYGQIEGCGVVSTYYNSFFYGVYQEGKRMYAQITLSYKGTSSSNPGTVTNLNGEIVFLGGKCYFYANYGNTGFYNSWSIYTANPQATYIKLILFK